MKTNKKIYRWECHWDNGTGLDRETCNCKGGWSSLETAIKNGKKHNKSHRWSGWGYAPMSWRNQTVNVLKKSRKYTVVVPYNEL